MQFQDAKNMAGKRGVLVLFVCEEIKWQA